MGTGSEEGGQHHEMGMRGVSRPMAEQEIRGGGEHEHAHGDDRGHMLRMHHRQTLWVYWTLILLGVWLIVSPFTFGYLNEAHWVAPSGGRGVWFGDELHTRLRALLMTWSDVVSGLLLVIFGWRALKPDRPMSLWLCCAVGVWISFAPVLFWAPTAAGYLNGTVTGMLVIALAVLIPGMPNMIMYMRMGPPRPPGWSYNPSSWPQRWILIALAFAGLLASRYLTAFQLGYTTTAWDPFFGEQSRRVLNSEMSHMWPVSDAALGAFAYTLEFLMGWMGGPARWRTMPWMVAFFGILVIPLGLVHIALVISQPVVVGAWCTLCLFAAAVMIPMIPLQVDEVIAMVQNLVHARRNGESVWRAFWKGGPAEGSEMDERTPELLTLPDQPAKVLGAAFYGVSLPWTLAASAALGVWLMFTPWAFGMEGTGSSLLHVGGAVIVVVAVTAMGEPLRAARFVNVLLGLATTVSLWLVPGVPVGARWNALAVGLVLIALSFPRGPVRESYGSWARRIA